MSEAKALKPFKPTELRRSQERLVLYRSDAIHAQIKVKENYFVRVCAYDLSPFGACITCNLDEQLYFREGQILEIWFSLPDAVKLTYFAKIKWQSNGKEKKYGLEFVEQVRPVASAIPLGEKNFPINLPEYFSLTGFFYKPYLFFERSPLKILAMTESIWLIKVYNSEMICHQGQSLDFWLTGLGPNSESICGEVLSIRNSGKGEAIIQLKVKNISKQIINWIGMQLIFICDKTPVEIRRLGIDIAKVSNGFRFRFVRTQDEYERVLKLRYKAYLEAGKVGTTKTYLDMAAPLDFKSRILVAYHGEKVVASVAIAFPSDDLEMLDTERAFVNGYPKPIPPKTQVVEIARLCTDSDYRRTDLLNRLFEYAYKVTICGDRKYILTSTDSKLWPLYKKLGFKKAGMSYAHPYLNGLEHHIIVAERAQPDLGKRISPLAWNYLWRDMNLYMNERVPISKFAYDKIRLSVYRLIGKLLNIKPNSEY